MRKASGFLTVNGQFYPTKQEALSAEAAYRFHKAMHEHMIEAKVPEVLRETLLDNVRMFVLSHGDEVKNYIAHIPSIPIIHDPDEEKAHTENRLLQIAAPEPDTGPVIETEDEADASLQAFLEGLGGDD